MSPLDYPVLIKGDQMAFSLNVMRGNGHSYRTDLEQLYTPWGFLAPMTNDSFDILDYLEDGWEGIQLAHRVSGAILIDHRARIYELMLFGNIVDDGVAAPPGFSKIRILAGPETIYVRSRLSADEQRAMMAMDLCPDFGDAVKLFGDCNPNQNHHYLIMGIKDIAAELVKRGHVKPIPNHTPPKRS